MQENKGWICPKCNRVYSHIIWECKKCNALIDKIQENSEKLQTAFNMTNDKIKENLKKEGINIGEVKLTETVVDNIYKVKTQGENKICFCPVCKKQIAIGGLHLCGDV